MSFERLIRFRDDRGQIGYGDVPLNLDINSLIGKNVKVLHGSPRDTLSTTNEEAIVTAVGS